MPLTIREALLVAASAKLAAITGISGLAPAQIERNRRDTVESMPAIVLRDGGQRVVDRLVGMDRHAIAFDVELYASAASGAAASTRLNEMLGAVQAALFADTTLGAGAFDVRLLDVGDPLVDVSDGADAVASLVARFEVEAWLRPNDPFTLAP